MTARHWGRAHLIQWAARRARPERTHTAAKLPFPSSFLTVKNFSSSSSVSPAPSQRLADLRGRSFRSMLARAAGEPGGPRGGRVASKCGCLQPEGCEKDFAYMVQLQPRN